MRFIYALGALLALTLHTYALDLKGYVNDYAGVLTLEQATALSKKAETLSNLPNHPQVVLLTVSDMGGVDVETFANRQFREWHLGQASHDNGVLIVNALKERKLRIEVGYGLEGNIPDAIAKTIISTVMIPNMKKSPPDYFAAYSGAIDQVGSFLPTEATPAKFSSQGDAGPGWLFYIIVALIGGATAWFVAIIVVERKRQIKAHEDYLAAELERRRLERERGNEKKEEPKQKPQRPAGYDFDEPVRPRPTPIRPQSDDYERRRREAENAARRRREAEEAAAAAAATSWVSSGSSSSNDDSWSKSSTSDTTPDFSGGGGSSGGGGASGEY